MSGKRSLPPEDHEAWEAVTRSIKPLPRPARPVPQPLGAPAPPALAKPSVRSSPAKPQILPKPRPVAPISVRAARRRGPPPIEARLLKALRRGQTPIDLRLDLHGQTQTRAHRLLERALGAGFARGARVMLVVTGTGLRRRLIEDELPGRGAPETAPGILRRVLPDWLSEPPFSDWVLGVSPAGPAHGGAGAFYVQLRRPRNGA